ncbi:hypothetical protein CASZ1_12870 [Cutibacterium acnes]|nr:hypothetical protein CASZ1_12870 [Cutibacterium acnes]BCB13384.1 hypothetical protein CASZ2_12880 [Cutibacterium acnes]BDE67681.1 hypothetical protein TPCU411_12860 [Cutibacterium acnes]
MDGDDQLGFLLCVGDQFPLRVGGQENPHLREDPRTLTSLLDPLRANIMFEFGVCAWLAPLVEEPANSKDPTAPTSRQRREDAPRRANWPQKLTKLRPARHGATAPH